MALFGVVFALGTGSALAQVTVEVANKSKVTEGNDLKITVKAKLARAEGVLPAATITVTAAMAETGSTPAATEAQTAEGNDVAFNPASTTITFPARQSDDPAADVTKEGVIVLQTTHDPDAEDEVLEVVFTLTDDATNATGLTSPSAATGATAETITIEDDETQEYVLTLKADAEPKEGKKEFMVTVKADPAHVQDAQTLRIGLSDPMYSVAPSSITLGLADATDPTTLMNSRDVTITTPENDENRSDDTLKIMALDAATSKELGMLEVEVADANMLPDVKVTVVDDEGEALDPQPESIMEGETIMIMVTAIDDKGKDKKAPEELMVSLMPTGTAGMRDYSLAKHPITIDKDKASSAAVKLMATEDNEVDMETLMFDASVAGDKDNGTGTNDVMGVLSLMIEDGTQKLVWAKTQEEVEAAVYGAKEAGMGADEMFNPGEMIEIMGGALFNAAEGAMLSYTAMSDNGDVASTSVGGGTVTVMAGDMEGMANITITAHATMPASGVKIAAQSDPAEASVMFPVDVMMEALTLTLMGPEDPNVAEGMSAEVTVMANRAVTEDMEIMLMRDRAMSSASDEDFTADSIMLMAGEKMATGMVMAVEDEMAEDMEELVLYAMAGDMEVMGTAKLYIWDAAVPALPIIAQLLLAAFLAAGGYRRYRRR